MAVSLETPPRITIPRPKARLLKGLARHASAPTRSHLTAGISKPAVVFRLRFERDDWRNTARIQEKQLLASQRDLRARGDTIADLENENAALHAAARDGDVSMNNTIFARYQDAMTKHDKLVDQLNEKDRTIARLKKSDRAKGKVWQRNLRLKTTLQRYASKATSSPANTDANTESSLLEALALAAERIEELESTGAVLLEALGQQNGSCGSEDEEEDSEARLLEAEVVFRGVMEDETFQEQKEMWKEMLNE
ncbi:hypothetical protein BDU57DRAFT_552665 [Ampelomyces quisqualis]|uniref:Uncharacterized protein n=1 Tax=Ampelomyces quisqualis TaxID=50730 RepID=A0A6A5R287_AMPQU|nr:hypothetical protein BDU57DRAFT_552665 [Ampelomyces quisqualis]